ncbi:hypothetical protein F4821DRAFT_274468 [Hypoxylon rubiginosum]|uniref:Uncharacterized protein n=1 Tax=Hypoxylon rubiginosum TaxID=110542 RepID=A0ACC0CNW4_9PEZI|nr:hypothetical protein F4821DRAFT_274468 [Hypoxylon rubiginosum]
MADPIIFNLSEERIEEGEFQTRSKPLNTPLIKFEIVGITHGKLTRKGDLATLLSFEFRFIAPQSCQRLTKVSVDLKFEDTEGQTSRDPVVHAISPEGSWEIGKTEVVRDVKYGADSSAHAGNEVLGAERGTLWGVKGLKSREFSISLTGVKNCAGKDNVVNWTLHENEYKESGIPTVMRAAILLRRPEDLPFTFTVKVKTQVPYIGEMKILYGLERMAPIDPVGVDPGRFPRAGRAVLKTLDPKTYDLQEMDTLDLEHAVDVALLTL